jgi:hypothetical protein
MHLSVEGEHARITFIREVYRGAQALALDLRQKNPGVALKISGSEAIAPFIEMLKAPSLAEAKMVEGVSFENVYSGRDVRYILAPKGKTTESLWLEAKAVVAEGEHSGEQPGLLVRIADRAIALLASPNKHYKFQQDPKRFFEDSRHGVVRWFAKFI